MSNHFYFTYWHWMTKLVLILWDIFQRLVHKQNYKKYQKNFRKNTQVKNIIWHALWHCLAIKEEDLADSSLISVIYFHGEKDWLEARRGRFLIWVKLPIKVIGFRLFLNIFTGNYKKIIEWNKSHWWVKFGYKFIYKIFY